MDPTTQTVVSPSVASLAAQLATIQAGLSQTQTTQAPLAIATAPDVVAPTTPTPSTVDPAPATQDASTELPESDPVIVPDHYARFAIEPIHFIMENDLGFVQGNVIKYVLRWDAKNGVEDLKKARRYLDMWIKKLDGDPDYTAKPA